MNSVELNNQKKSSTFEFGYSGIFTELEELAKTHSSFLHLSNCDPPLYGYQLDSTILERIDRLSFSKFSPYPTWNGDKELRQALAQRIQSMCNVNLPPSRIVLTYGVSEGFPLAFDTLFHLRSGSVAIPDPSYIPLIVQAQRFGKIWFYHCIESDAWNPDLDQLVDSLEKHPDTQAIVIITPNSPTGAIYPEKVLRELINIAGQFNLIVITDEIYDSLSFINFFSPLQFASEVPVIYLNGFSKVYRLPGYRLGYLGWHDPSEKMPGFWDRLVHLCKGRLGVTSFAQEIAKLALQEPPETLKAYAEDLHKKHLFLTRHLEEVEGISAIPANGGTYVFPKLNLNIKDEELARYLIKHHAIFVTPGSAYGPIVSPGHLRFVTLESNDSLLRGVQALEESLKRLG
ncbi:MAG: aminotransferase class I/II-fold pyridoxal phosphate-dependent enzyme [Candidatus Heimdallarchaeota archaeon]